MSKRAGGEKRNWTLQMNMGLLECKRKAELLVASEGRKALCPLWKSIGKKLSMLNWILQAKIYGTRGRAWRRLWEWNGNYYFVSGSKRSRITGISIAQAVLERLRAHSSRKSYRLPQSYFCQGGISAVVLRRKNDPHSKSRRIQEPELDTNHMPRYSL